MIMVRSLVLGCEGADGCAKAIGAPMAPASAAPAPMPLMSSRRDACIVPPRFFAGARLTVLRRLAHELGPVMRPGGLSPPSCQRTGHYPRPSWEPRPKGPRSTHIGTINKEDRP